MENFNFATDYILEDDRILLRPILMSDTDHLLTFVSNEPEIWKYSSKSPAGSRENLERYIATTLDARINKTEYPFIVFDKRTQRYAGSTRFYDMQFHHQSLQLGYTWYGRDYQGTGLNRHCKFLLLQFAFEKLNMERVEFRADNNNARSIAAMKSIGCVVEGVLRANMPKVDGGRRDSIILSVLKNEWPGVKEQLAERLKQF